MSDPRDLVDLYLRLSVDRDGKDSLERQEKDLRAWATREGLTVRTVWADKVSGFKKVNRDDFDGAVSAVSSGEVGTLAVWKLDRLSRRGAGQVGLVLDDVEEVGGRLFFLKDSLDSTVPGHRMVILVVSEQARAESANTSLRVRDKIAKDAAKGIPKKGTRPFGYEPDGITLRPSEADLIRDAVADVLAGERSMLRIAKDWTEAGVLTDGMKRERRGKDGIKKPALRRWTATTVRSVLLRERNAGLLVHEGVVMPVSLIQSIITLEDHDNLKARVKVGIPLSGRAHSLLGGIIRCGECDATMHGTIAYSQRKGGPRNVYRVYKCQNTLYDKSRRHASIQAPIADDLFVGFIFRDLFVDELHSPETDDRTAALKAVTARLASLVESIEHVGHVLLDPSLKSLHSQARGELKVREAERSGLEQERDALLAQTVDGGALAAFIAEWRSRGEGFSDEADMEDWNRRFWAAWEGVGLDGQRAMIRARYRPSVRVGGRGVGRISPHPINPVTFGQPV
ncbi:recombinase family protein [Microbacterium sp. LWH13-1.2]|uniref:recombinase family protein n=1 Tax=Microbacterium sp. LWH13-1.2 TaxID=3135260 RepID=UPI00313A4273